MLRKLSILSVWLYVVSFPFYFLPSLRPQVNEFIFLVLILPTFASATIKNSIKYNKCLSYYISFAIWVTVVCTVNSIYYNEEIIFIYSLVYTYSVLLLLIMYNLKRIYDVPIVSHLTYAIVFSLSVQFVVSFLYGGYVNHPNRMTNFFNNPNQLGYYSVLSSACISISYWNGFVNKYTTFASLLAALLISVGSESQASIISIFVLTIAFLVMLFNKKKRHYKSLGLVLLTLTVLSILLFKINSLVDLTPSGTQLAGFDETFSDLKTNRGYRRMLSYPAYIMFGYGEGAYSRFDIMSGSEVHSGFATILISYGIVGLFLFTYPLFKKFAVKPYYVNIVAICVFTYNVSHQGFRFNYFWIFLFIYLFSSSNQNDRNG